jgi:hypothetical protein
LRIKGSACNEIKVLIKSAYIYRDGFVVEKSQRKPPKLSRQLNIEHRSFISIGRFYGSSIICIDNIEHRS